jgi:hypothetical protein
MRTSLARLNRRTKTLLAVIGVALIIDIAAGALLALTPSLLTRVARDLSGTATEIVYPPDWTIGQNNTYVLSPMHALQAVKVLAYDMWNPNNVGIWPWDANSTDNRTWYFVPTRGRRLF